ncbi:beta-1,3-galactosyl-O-glycosyl-glycoprotein beta-1,6-N-acetylglucosaminyltransferase 4-like [Spinachia spinachia]
MKLRRATCSLLLLSFWVLLMVSLQYFPENPPPSASSQNHGMHHKYNINCQAIHDLDPVEVGKLMVIRQKLVVEDREETLVDLVSDCPVFIKSRGYDGACVSEGERDFPLAYSLVVHKSAVMVERLLRAVYTPTNIYCIHYDQKSPALFASAMEGLARCLPNVFIASKREAVYYAGISRLKADLDCLTDLLASDVQWKYVINLCGQDFPLRSNIELVSELKALNGANMLETTRPSKAKKQRFTFHHELSYVNLGFKKVPMKTRQRKSPPPHGIQVFSGNAYFVLSRDFVAHVESSAVVRDFLAWSEDTYSPDEHFWATLARLPGVPGEVARTQADITDLQSRTRLVKWDYLEGRLYPPCSGTHVRNVCIYGAAEMRWLLNYGHWFANKFDLLVDPVVVQCLEEKLEEKRRLFQSIASPNCREGSERKLQ